MAIDRKKYMDKAEIQQLRRATEAAAYLDLQKGRVKNVVAWMLVDLALSTGLRVSEIANLKITDVDLRRGALKVIRSKKKHKKVETLPIGKDLSKHLKEYMDWTGRTKGALFESQRSASMTIAGLQQVWKSAVKRAGLPGELSIHSARHTTAVMLLKKTSNLRMVQKQLGHSSPQTTANMYADVSFEDMQASVNGLFDD